MGNEGEEPLYSLDSFHYEILGDVWVDFPKVSRYGFPASDLDFFCNEPRFEGLDIPGYSVPSGLYYRSLWVGPFPTQ